MKSLTTQKHIWYSDHLHIDRLILTAGCGVFGVAMASFADSSATAGVAGANPVGCYLADSVGSGPTAQGSVAAGCGATSSSPNSTAAGFQASATGTNAVSLGAKSSGAGTSTVAVGSDAFATGGFSTAIGTSSRATNQYAVTTGAGSTAAGDFSTAFGSQAKASDERTIALGQASIASGSGSTALGQASLASHARSVALGELTKTAETIATARTTINGLSYNFAGSTPVATVSIGDASNADPALRETRTLTNLGAGQITAESTDGVNGSQLFVTNQAVTLTNTRLNTVASSTATALGSGAEWDETTGKWTGPTYTIQEHSYNNVGDALSELNSAFSSQTTNINTLLTDALLWNPTLDAYDAGHGSGSSQKITNAAAGTVNATSTDVVNGSQLFNTSKSIADAFGGETTVNADGTIKTPTYSVQNQSFTTVYDAVNAIDGNLTSVSNQLTTINNGGGIKYFHANSTEADSQASGANSVAIGPSSVAAGQGNLTAGHNAQATMDAAVALGQNATATNIGDVALGAGSTTTTAVATLGTTLNGKDYKFAGTSPQNTLSIGDASKERTLTNLAAGRLNETSTDAVNGSQLYATNQAVNQFNTNVSQVDKNSIKYDLNDDGSKKNSVSLIGGDPNQPVVLANVADGIKNNDAANVGQLKDGISSTLQQTKSYADERIIYANNYTDQTAKQTLQDSKSYTDKKFGELNVNLDGIRSEARQAAAIGLAASSLRYDDRPGKLSAAFGAGLWRSETAIAMGLGYTSEGGRVRTNISAVSAGGEWGGGVGLSYTFN